MEILIGIAVLLAIHFGLGVIACGWVFAYFQRAYPELAEACYESDREFALESIWWGVIAFASEVFDNDRKYGWQWPRRKK